MSFLGCSVWPKRWEDFFDCVVADTEKNGCIYADGKYLDEINKRYAI